MIGESELKKTLLDGERVVETYSDSAGRSFAVTTERVLLWRGYYWDTYIMPDDEGEIPDWPKFGGEEASGEG